MEKPKDITLSEIDSKKIVESIEFQTLINVQFELVLKIDSTIKSGIPKQRLENEALLSIQNIKNDFYDLVFENSKAGEKFIERFQLACKTFLQKYPDLEKNRNEFVCSSCSLQPIEYKVKWFFKNFEIFNSARLNKQTPVLSRAQVAADLIENDDDPVCGSYWNQVKLGTCSALCGASTVGLGGPLCVWGCWCTFCTKNSSVADAICSN